MKIGNMLLIQINGWPQHLAIVSELKPHITIIHSYAQVGKVIEQYLPERWEADIVSLYDFNYLK